MYSIAYICGSKPGGWDPPRGPDIFKDTLWILLVNKVMFTFSVSLMPHKHSDKDVYTVASVLTRVQECPCVRT